MYEYKIVKPLAHEVEKRLNEWAEGEWRICAIAFDKYEQMEGLRVHYAVVVLERERKEKAAEENTESA